MIDTIVLTLPINQVTIKDHHRFNPSSIGLVQPPYYPLGKAGYFKCHQNPAKDDGIYRPRLTITRRYIGTGHQVMLKIEFSIPKLIFGNNFDEVCNKDFDQIISTLQTRLREMGIVTVSALLRQATVSGVHYSKNIPLTDYSTPRAILKELYKVKMTRRLDMNQTDFRNEGHSLKWHTNDFELSFYDKIKDLEQSRISEKRSIEKQNNLQYTLFDPLQKRKSFEVLRMEARLNTKKRINAIIEKLQIIGDCSFRSIFDEKKSKAVLNHLLGNIKTEYMFIAIRPSQYAELLAGLKRSNPTITFIKALQVIGYTVCVNEVGSRETQEISRIFGKRTWESTLRRFKQYVFPDGDYSLFKPLEKALNEFTPLRVNEYL